MLEITHIGNPVGRDFYYTDDFEAGDLEVVVTISIPAAAMPDDNLVEEVAPWED